MSKKIASLGIDLHLDGVDTLDFNTKNALMDYDIVILIPLIPLYDNDSNVQYWKNEFKEFVNNGKTIYVILIASYTYKSSNTYKMFPFDFECYNTQIGSNIKKAENSVLNKFYDNYKKSFNYKMTYSQTKPESNIIFTGNDTSKVLGSIIKYESKGHVVLLPYINIIAVNSQSNYYSCDESDSVKFINTIIEIDKNLKWKSNTTPPPAWVLTPEYFTENEKNIEEAIKSTKKSIDDFEEKKTELNINLKEEQAFKGLLYETGIPLENIVKKALALLEYEVEEYDKDGDEIDIILKSPDGHIYVCECEGSNNAINVNKFRQLHDHIGIYAKYINYEKTVYGILFGNPYRLKDIKNREEPFTEHCIKGASNNNYALIQTKDLFPIVKYLREHDNAEDKSLCRKAIHESLGHVVVFPPIPTP